MKLTDNQKIIKNELVSLIQTNFQVHQPQPVWFTAPTGAGKTFIVSKAIEDMVFDTEPAVPTAVLFFTLSQANLPNQIKNDFYHYRVKFNYHYIAAPSQSSSESDSDITNLIAEPNCVYIFGIDTLKKNSILQEKNRFDLFVENLTSTNQQVLVVGDEAHIRAGNQNNKFQHQVINLIKHYFQNHYLILKITATIPDHIQDPIITMEEHHATEDSLIKSCKKILCDQNEKLSYLELINKGLKEFKQIRKKYRQDGQINPAVLVQISTQAACNTPEGNANWRTLRQAIDEHELNGCLGTSKKKILCPRLRKITPSLEYLSRANCEVDVIIFIYALATGGDIPRACMLMQLTELKSKQLTRQTIGRIRRNPTRPLKVIKNTIYDKYVLYTNLKADRKFMLELKTPFKKTKFYTLQVDPGRTQFRNYAEKAKNVNNYLNQNQAKIGSDFDLYFKKLTYQDQERSINSGKEQRRRRNISNLLELAQTGQKRLPGKKLRQTIENGTANNCKNKKICYQDRHFSQTTNGEGYLFWLNHKKGLKPTIENGKSNYKLPEQLTQDDLKPPFVRAMAETGLFIFQSKTEGSFDIDQKYEEFFPYTSEQPVTKIGLDSQTEQKRIDSGFKMLKQLSEDRVIDHLQFTCKNFLQLNISYELGDNQKDRSSAQHPDLIIKFNKHKLEYTLLIEIKSQQYNRQYDSAQLPAEYEQRIKMIKQSYPAFAQKLAGQNYVFILDLTQTDHQQTITIGQAGQVDTVNNVKQCLESIFSGSAE